MSKTDQIYAEALPDIPVFNFDSTVADVFTDMINRSVPAINRYWAYSAH